jgi:hypothetical protein
MSAVPLASSSDQDLHFVLCDFGHYGRAYVETDPAEELPQSSANSCRVANMVDPSDQHLRESKTWHGS